MASWGPLLVRIVFRVIVVVWGVNGVVLAVWPKFHNKLPWWMRITPTLNCSYGPYDATNRFPVPILAARLVGIINVVVAIIFLFGLPPYHLKF